MVSAGGERKTEHGKCDWLCDGTGCSIKWNTQSRSSWRRRELSKNIKERMELGKWIFEAITFQAEGAAGANALWWDCACHVEGPG